MMMRSIFVVLGHCVHDQKWLMSEESTKRREVRHSQIECARTNRSAKAAWEGLRSNEYFKFEARANKSLPVAL